MGLNARREKILRDYPHYAEEIQKLNAELNQTLQLKLCTQDTLKAQALTGMPSSSGISDVTYNAVEQNIDRHEQHIVYLSNKIKEIYDHKEIIDGLLPKLTMEEYRVVDLHYFKGYKMHRVGYIMHYQKSRCYELKDSAVKKISALS